MRSGNIFNVVTQSLLNLVLKIRKRRAVFLFLLCLACKSFSKSPDSLAVQKRNVYFIALARVWEPGKVKIEHFIYYDDGLYSGNYWDGYNLGCISLQDTAIKKEIDELKLTDKIFSLRDSKTIDDFNRFNTSNSYLNEFYLWSCISVNLSFVKLNCDVESKLFNNELYRHPNGIMPLEFEKKSIRKVNRLPKKLLDGLIYYQKKVE
jgi:hypothetical protein